MRRKKRKELQAKRYHIKNQMRNAAFSTRKLSADYWKLLNMRKERGKKNMVIEDLYFGKCCPRERYGRASSEYVRLRALALAADNCMLAMLTDEQKIQFEKCQQTADELSALEEREAFATGFCLATKIMAEVMHDTEMRSVEG